MFFTLPLTLVILPNPDNLALLQIIKGHILSICFPILITNDFEYGPSLSMSYLGREVFSISIVSPHCRIDSTLSTLSVLLSIWPKHIDINSSADQSETLAISWVKLQASRCLKSSFAPSIDMIIQWLMVMSREAGVREAPF